MKERPKGCCGITEVLGITMMSSRSKVSAEVLRFFRWRWEGKM